MKNLRTVCEGAVLVALSLVLGISLKIPMAVNGGSLSLAMVPLVVYALRRGPAYGFGACFVYGFLKCLSGDGISRGLPSVMLDYVLAYGVIGFAGFFGRLKSNAVLRATAATVVACFARFCIHFISGVTIYAITTSTELNGVIYTNAALYSLVYNALYMLPDTVFTVVVVGLLAVALEKTPYPMKRV